MNGDERGLLYTRYLKWYNNHKTMYDLKDEKDNANMKAAFQKMKKEIMQAFDEEDKEDNWWKGTTNDE
jgi:hypothetical protein